MQTRKRRFAGLLALVCLLVSWAVPGMAQPGPDPETAIPDAADNAAAEDGTILPDPTAPGIPAFGSLTADPVNEPGCTFLVISDSADPDVVEADVLVWTQADQSDLQRAAAVPGATGWSAAVDTSRFHYLAATYSVQLVGRNSAGVVVDRSEVLEVPLAPQEAVLSVRPANLLKTAYRFTLETAELAGPPDVWFEISEADAGICAVIDAERTADGYTALVPISALGAAGELNVMACYGHSGECRQQLAEAAFTADRLVHSGLSVHSDSSTGDFYCTLGVQSPLGVEVARVAIWSDPDQGDLRWVEMEQTADGFYRSPTQSVRDYGGFGLYTMHAYVELGDGSNELASALRTALVARNCITVAHPARGRYSVSVEGPSPSRDINIAVWSDRNGQDDLVWYPASRSGSVWSAAALTSRHKDAGTWNAHVYSGNTYLGAVTFEVPESELLSEAEQRIAAGCQKVYDAVGTDLHKNYLWVVRNLSYVRRSGHLTPPSGYTRQQWYAVEGLEKRTGNCYTYASTFCELARGLGYDARYVEGAVWGVGQKWWPHGFVLITIDGSTYICDPELQYASSAGRNLYMQPISNPRATYTW